MWKKIFLVALALAFLAMCALNYFSYSWLQSITAPQDVIAKYEYYSSLTWWSLWISSVILLILANIIFWTGRQTWAFWVVLGYFVVFVIAQTFWLAPAFFRYKEEKGLQDGFSFSPILGVLLCAAAAGFVFFNQFLAFKMRDKMFLKKEPDAEFSETEVKSERENDFESSS